MSSRKADQPDSQIPASMTLGAHLDRIESMQGQIRNRLDTIDDKQDRQLVLLEGTAENPAGGLVMRVDRLERAETTRVRLVWIAVTAATAALLDVLRRFFHGG